MKVFIKMERFLINKKRRVEIALPDEMWEEIIMRCSWSEYYYLRQTCRQLYEVCNSEKVRRLMEDTAEDILINNDVFLSCACENYNNSLVDNPHTFVEGKCYPFMHYLDQSKGLRSTRIDEEAKQICEFDMGKTKGGVFVFINLFVSFLSDDDLKEFPNSLKRFVFVKLKLLGCRTGPIPLYLKCDP